MYKQNLLAKSFLGIFSFIALTSIFLEISYRELIDIFYVNSGWKLGDWIIHYPGEFVRRGLLGTIFIYLGNILPFSPLTLIYGFQEASYFILFFVCFLFLRKSSFDILKMALVFSPAFILFPLLDPRAGFRKEIIHFALLSLFLQTASFRKRQILSALWVVSIFAHEMLFVFLPYYIFGIMNHKGESTIATRRKFSFLLGTAGVVAFSLVSFFSGSSKVAFKLCRNALEYGHYEICNGAISNFGKTLQDGKSWVESINLQTGYLETYPILALLALLPILIQFGLQLRSQGLKQGLKHLKPILFPTILSTALTFPLYFIAIDWGRFIHIQVVSCSLLILAKGENTSPLFENHKIQLRSFFLLLLAIPWCLSWGMAHCCYPKGLGGLYTYLKARFDL